MTSPLYMSGVFGLKSEMSLKLNKTVIPDIRREVLRRLRIGSKRIAATARQLAPVDPHSRIAAGRSKQGWPRMHHARSIRLINGGMKEISAGVKTISNRFYFIEFPTRRGIGGRRGQYSVVRDPRTGRRKRGHGATKRIGLNTMRTPGQPHFWPAVVMHTQAIYESLRGII